MKHRVFCMLVPLGLAVTLLLALTALQPALAQGEIYYVNAATGDDTRTPTQAQNPSTPWKTIDHAALSVPAGETLNPNLIQVAAGTYDAALGETFPITFTNPHIRLLGDPAGTTTIDGGGTITIIKIDVEGIRIEGFSILDANIGIEATASPVIVDNIFDDMYFYGMLVNIQETPGTDRVVPDIVINSNTITTTGIMAVNVLLDLYGQDQPLDIQIGDITINSNTINLGPSAEGIRLAVTPARYLDGGSVTARPVDISGNHITGGTYGIDYSNSLYYLTDSTATAANLRFHNNVLRSQQYAGLYLDYDEAHDIAGNSMITLGDLSVSGNDVSCDLSQCMGISIPDYGRFNYMSGSASTHAGVITITANTVAAATGVGLKLNYISYLSDQSKFTGGDFWVSGNVISATYAGVDVTYEQVASENTGNSQVWLGTIHLLDNQIVAGEDGIAIEYAENSVGESNTENAYAQLPSYQIQGNTIVANQYGLRLSSTGNPNGSINNTLLEFGSMEVNDNAFSGGLYGMSLSYDFICKDCNDGSEAEIGNILVTDNTFTDHDTAAINMYFYGPSNTIVHTSTLTMEDVLIAGNMISDVGMGIGMFTYNYIYQESELNTGNLDVRENKIYNATSNAISISSHRSIDATGTVNVGETHVAGNHIESCGGNGLSYTDETPTNSAVSQGDLFVDGNTVLGCNDGIDLFKVNQDVHLTNNILADLGGHAIWIFEARVDILHNTLVGAGIADTFGVLANGSTLVDTIVNITDTIVVSFTAAITATPGATAWEDYNLLSWNSVPSGDAVTSGGHSLVNQDPAFADPANHDYHITPNSRALNAGVDAGVNWDIDGDKRPTNGGFDIGADELNITIYLPLLMKQ